MQEAKLDNMKTLGAAEVDSATLAGIAAAALGEPVAEVLSAKATEITFPMFNMTTGGLWRVEGTVHTNSCGDGGQARAARGFSTVLKLVQSPLLWSGIGQGPASLQGGPAHYRWRTEGEVYASKLAEAMPAGSRLPTVYSIEELDEQRTALWMEDISECPDAAWTDERFRDAATLLGRLAGTSAARDLGPDISAVRDADRLRFYLDGPGAMVFMPAIRGEDLWRVPAVADAADRHLIAGLRSLTDRADELADEMLALPTLPAHGDASPQNLLIESAGGGPGGITEFVVIDWGLYGGACAGFDLGQLLAGLGQPGHDGRG